MEFIAHRINTVKELNSLNPIYGVELDLRDDLNERIYIQHNPFERGEDFEGYLKQYHHGTMILNIKSERIECEVLALLRKYGITKYFFLDSSFPMIHLLCKMGEKNIALRVSEYEGLDTARNMAGKIAWIWLDCFNKIPINKDEADELHTLGYKLCLVSPELQGRNDDIEKYARQLKNIKVEAICTKQYNIERWNKVQNIFRREDK